MTDLLFGESKSAFRSARILAAGFILALMSTMMACPTRSPVVPVDASDGSSKDGVVVTQSMASRVCDHLRDLHCSAGYANDAGDSCEAVFDHAQSSGLFNMKGDCLLAAPSLEAARACGSVSCE